VQDLNKLWRDGVRLYDAYKKKYCIIRAMVFCTINDFLAFGNMSGLKTKGAKIYLICGDNTHSIRLKNYKKNIYMGHRRFHTRYHPYRWKKKEFDGKVDTR
jgi:Transposase family tnp2